MKTTQTKDYDCPHVPGCIILARGERAPEFVISVYDEYRSYRPYRLSMNIMRITAAQVLRVSPTDTILDLPEQWSDPT